MILMPPETVSENKNDSFTLHKLTTWYESHELEFNHSTATQLFYMYTISIIWHKFNLVS